MHKWFLAATCLLLVGCSTPVSTTLPVNAPATSDTIGKDTTSNDTSGKGTAGNDTVSSGGTGTTAPTADTLVPVTDSTLQARTKAPSCAPVDTRDIRAVRFDPSYYYGTGLSAAQLSEQLISQWAQNGVNTVYFMAYNPTYGARYQTSYTLNVMEDWGKLDLMGEMLKAASARNIRVIAWISDFRHGGAIAQNPGWASQDKTGAPYVSGEDLQFMTLASSSAESWYQGFIRDLLTRYPGLAGVDLAEPVVNWWGDEADYSPTFTKAFNRAYPGAALGGPQWRAYRASLLTKHLQTTIQTVRSFCKSVHVTMPITADASGNLMTSAAMANETGFNLEALLSGSVKPDVMNIELIWQQWKASYGTAVFTPQWTQTATAQAIAAVAGRARTVVHVEATQFGNVTPLPSDLQDSLSAAMQGGAEGLDVYQTQQLDTQQSWSHLAAVYQPLATATR